MGLLAPHLSLHVCWHAHGASLSLSIFCVDTDTGVAAGAVVYAEVGAGADGNKNGYMDIPGAAANGGGNRTVLNGMYAQTSQTSGYMDVAPMDDGMEEDV